MRKENKKIQLIIAAHLIKNDSQKTEFEYLNKNAVKGKII